ncbi:MAG: PA2779 family protein [Xanthomonadales bacterium]|nr:PA2779 family protein [Xanthomonadales bacterium]
MIKKWNAVFLSALLIWAGLSTTAFGTMISTHDAISSEVRAERIEQIQSQLAREDVQRAMVQLGVDPEEASARVAALSDHELLELEQSLETLPAGGGFFALVGVVFVVLMILEFVGVTDIFKRA